MKTTRQKKGLNRNVIDKYYTNSDIVLMCVALIKEHVSIDYQNDLIIEPSAGNGAFIDELKILAQNTLFYDLEPEHAEIAKQDFLRLEHKFEHVTGKIHIIGNPPFGRQSSSAIQFIKKSCMFGNTISFILPKSFKKDSMKKSFPQNFHLLYEVDLPENAFLVNGQEHNVPCVFQMWEKQSTNRRSSEKLTPVGFRFVSQTENPHISFRRVGVNAGVIDIHNIYEKSQQSHYFIQFTNGKTIDDNVELLSNIQFETSNNTVGPKSISKQELMAKFNVVLMQ